MAEAVLILEPQKSCGLFVMFGGDGRCYTLSEGGTHDRNNLIALCKSCHS